MGQEVSRVGSPLHRHVQTHCCLSGSDLVRWEVMSREMLLCCFHRMLRTLPWGGRGSKDRGRMSREEAATIIQVTRDIWEEDEVLALGIHHGRCHLDIKWMVSCHVDFRDVLAKGTNWEVSIRWCFKL